MPRIVSGDQWCLIVASGPSLRRADLELLRHEVDYCCAVNNAVFWTPWADCMYAADSVWWKYYGWRISWFKGQRYARGRPSRNVQQWRGVNWARTGGNSGHQALQMMVEFGARKVALIGFDHQHTGGKKHFFGDHPRKPGVRLGNARHTDQWVRYMNLTAKELVKMRVEVINLSRETALECFPRVTVEEFITW